MRAGPSMRQLAALALALLPALAFAQQLPNTLQPPPRVAPIAPNSPPPLPRGVDTSRDNSLQTLNRQIDASSRRVGVDTLRNQVDRQDRLMDADRAQTDARRPSPNVSARTSKRVVPPMTRGVRARKRRYSGSRHRTFRLHRR